jgi:hypothetical protein
MGIIDAGEVFALLFAAEMALEFNIDIARSEDRSHGIAVLQITEQSDHAGSEIFDVAPGGSPFPFGRACVHTGKQAAKVLVAAAVFD